MNIRQFLLSHRKALIVVAFLIMFIGTSVYQSIYANDDGIPTTTIYWPLENSPLVDRDATWILPHDSGYLIITSQGTLAAHINAGMSLSFVHTADEPQTKFMHAFPMTKSIGSCVPRKRSRHIPIPCAPCQLTVKFCPKPSYPERIPHMWTAA